MEDDIYSVKPIKEEEVKEIAYYRPKFWKRVFLRLFDFLIYALLAVGLFTGARAIVTNTPYYQEQDTLLNTYKVDSSLFVYAHDLHRYQDIVTFLNYSNNSDMSAQRVELKKRINEFHTFLADYLTEKEMVDVQNYYDGYRLNYVYAGQHAFTITGGQITENLNDVITSKVFVNNIYKPYIDNTALGLFSAKVPNVLEIEKFESNMLFFVEMPIAIILGAVIYYYVIPLCFSRGKKTLGRFLFKVALVDKDVLSVSWKRYSLRFLIVLFAEIILSIPTAGIPLFVSISMMAFSKKKQSFADFFLDTQEIDCSESKIFKSKEEVYSYNEKPKHHDFKLK